MKTKLRLREKLLNFKNKLEKEVEIHYKHGNLNKGNQKLNEWLGEFEAFLSDYISSSLELFKKLKNNTTVTRADNLGLFSQYKNQIGDNIHSILTLLIEDIDNRNIKMETSEKRKKVFIVHGRDTKIVNEMKYFLRAIDLKPIEWEDARGLTGEPTPPILKIIDTAFKEAQAILVLFTGDDLAKLKDDFITQNDQDYESKNMPQPRQNVLFEAGMAWQKDHKRTVLVQIGKVRPMSDIHGIHVLRISDDKSKKKLADRLRDAGCDIKLHGTGWMDAGTFI
jgi:predicted nucleotide-binding protein